jgi:hypothetical protein
MFNVSLIFIMFAISKFLSPFVIFSFILFT